MSASLRRAEGAPPLLRVALTGGLASGKTTVLGELAAQGVAVVDDDELAREALAPGSPLVPLVAAALGAGVLRPDGSLDRARVAALVFARPELRRALEALVHPEVLRREEEEIARAARQGHALAVVDVPLLVETGRARAFDRVVVARCAPEEQLRRAVARGLAEEDARRRVAAQAADADRLAVADYVVDTSGAPEETRARARALLALLEQDAAALGAGRPLERRR